MRLKSIVRFTLFELIHSLYLDRFKWNKQNIIYFGHSVSANICDGLYKYIPNQFMSKDNFVDRIKTIKKFRTFVSMDEYLESSDNRLSTLTFDDCYLELYRTVNPILAEEKIPVLYYITTGCLLQKHLLWCDTVYCTINETEKYILELETMKCRFTIQDFKARAFAATKICGMLWDMTIEEQRNVIKELNEKLGFPKVLPPNLYLNENHVKILSKFPWVTIGSHTITHPNLTLISNSQLKHELLDSKKILEDITKTEIKHLSLPNGMGNDKVINSAQEAGYKTIAMTDNGKGGLLNLRRINIGRANFSEFMGRNSGLVSW